MSIIIVIPAVDNIIGVLSIATTENFSNIYSGLITKKCITMHSYKLNFWLYTPVLSYHFLAVVQIGFKPVKPKSSLHVNVSLCIYPLTFITEVLVATVKIPPALADMASTLSSLPGVHDSLCY